VAFPALARIGLGLSQELSGCGKIAQMEHLAIYK
jgi:hypothetical protein